MATYSGSVTYTGSVGSSNITLQNASISLYTSSPVTLPSNTQSYSFTINAVYSSRKPSGYNVEKYWSVYVNSIYVGANSRDASATGSYQHNLTSGAKISDWFMNNSNTNIYFNGDSTSGMQLTNSQTITVTVSYTYITRDPTPPTGVTCSLSSNYLKAGQSTTLSWTTSGGTPTGYYAYKNGSGTPFYSGTNAYTSVTANSTVNDSDYYTVRAYNNDGYADSSAVRLYTYKDPTVDSITLTPSTAGYGKNVSVAWTATNGGTYNAISSYTIQINNVDVKTGQSSSPCTITAPLTGASATIKVIAVGTQINSTGSGTATLTLKANNSIIYRSNGTTYVQEMIYRSDGTSWVPLFVYRSNGTNWIKMG